MFDPSMAIAGGLVTSVLGEYVGIKSPVLAVLAAGLGGTIVSKAKNFYNVNKNVLPPVMKVHETIDSLQSKVGLKFFSIVIAKGENVVFNKLESYILHKYSDHIVSGHINEINNAKLAFSISTSQFSRSLVDYFEDKKILLSVENNDIHVQSRSAPIDKLREYIAHVMTLRLGTRTLSVHQPIIEIVKSKKEDGERVDVYWKTFKIKTNKTFQNTIVTDKVQKELVDDLKEFIDNEEYYNLKGIPYKRGYLLYGPPGTGKTSIIKSIASQYGMDIFLINMGEIKSEKELTQVFQGTRSCDGYHMLCFEDIDRCEFLQKDRYDKEAEKTSTIRTFLNELDGVIENPKRITILTVNNKDAIMNIPAMIRPGRIDKAINLDYCDADQINRLYNHFSDNEDKLNIVDSDIQGMNITPAQVVKYILTTPEITVDKIKKNIESISDISVSDKSLNSGLNNVNGVRKTKGKRIKKSSQTKSMITRYKNQLKNLPSKIEKAEGKYEKEKEKEKEANKKERVKRRREKMRKSSKKQSTKKRVKVNHS